MPSPASREASARQWRAPSVWLRKQFELVPPRYQYEVCEQKPCKKGFKFEGMADLADISEKGDHSVSYNLKSVYYHAGLHPMTQRFVEIRCELVYYEYTCLAFGLSTAPWVFSKVMRELVMYWRRCGIRNLPYLDDLFFPKKGSRACRLVRIRIEGDCFKAGLLINF